MNIFSHTEAEFSAQFAKGKLFARDLYRQWFKKGALTLTEPAFIQAKACVEAIVSSCDWTLPEIAHVTKEGDTQKFLLKTHDNQMVESVAIPMKTLMTLCVSSQVGCRMGCTFCETGRMGLIRNLTAAEIVQQVFAAKFLLNIPIRNVVFMGMGEPFDNYDEVKQAIRILTDQNGLALGMHGITVSTSGKTEAILRLAHDKDIAPNLAVSINAPNDALRSKIMPHNRKENMAKLKETIQAYTQITGREVLAAYVLMKDVNDSLSYADELADYVRDLNVKVNLIPYNAQSNDRFQSPDNEVVDAFLARLRSHNIRVLLRRTKGRSIMAGCGQLGNAVLGGKLTQIQDRMRL
ncbi:MAG: 23S rRNA (adenine(2503)-C(2))-methyltransferase RlmN [Verrucomicrobia bacterium]|nr:23S rRNA (adenine(2503)-C(2))-methyltransferase RlmN [Verrucomicrobiota bacterium]MBS0637538.1 23S rRNA (adenine(2503)-C(2))-methyltransferase RlmN [Verrucomicrobiota bacterium]